jgi:hypothetical protein
MSVNISPMTCYFLFQLNFEISNVSALVASINDMINNNEVYFTIDDIPAAGIPVRRYIPAANRKL